MDCYFPFQPSDGTIYAEVGSTIPRGGTGRPTEPVDTTIYATVDFKAQPKDIDSDEDTRRLLIHY